MFYYMIKTIGIYYKKYLICTIFEEIVPRSLELKHFILIQTNINILMIYVQQMTYTSEKLTPYSTDN